MKGRSRFLIFLILTTPCLTSCTATPNISDGDRYNCLILLKPAKDVLDKINSWMSQQNQANQGPTVLNEGFITTAGISSIAGANALGSANEKLRKLYVSVEVSFQDLSTELPLRREDLDDEQMQLLERAISAVRKLNTFCNRE